MLTQQLQLVADDELQQFGINPTATNMSDKEYAANMLELAARRRWERGDLRVLVVGCVSNAVRRP
jgi:hypothetical protein